MTHSRARNDLIDTTPSFFRWCRSPPPTPYYPMARFCAAGLSNQACPVVCLSICLSVFVSVCLSISLSVFVSVCLFICLSVFVSVCLSISLSVFVSVCLSVSLSLCLSVCLSVSLSVCQSGKKNILKPTKSTIHNLRYTSIIVCKQ